jgi:hypothetical protein
MADTAQKVQTDDRRARSGFRALIEEMMQQIREVTRRDDWTAEERARAEADLERIMASVRRQAMNHTDEA